MAQLHPLYLQIKILISLLVSDLERIAKPICIAQSELDEFIKMEHAVYLADTLQNARLKVLEGVSHFAPLQNPELFANEIINFFNDL